MPVRSQTRWGDLARLMPALLLALELSAAGEALAQGATPAARRELAPTGALRLGLLTGNPNIASVDPATGALHGPGVDLGRELAQRLGVPYAPVGYPSSADTLGGIRAGEVDVVILGIDPSRAAEFAFAPPYIEEDQTYIVPADSPIRTAADVDRPGVRIAAVPGSVFSLTLERQLRAAELVGMERAQVWAALADGSVQAHAFGRQGLLLDAAQRPGLRLVEGRFGVSELAVMLSPGRPAALAFVTQVVEQAKASGLVQRWVAQAGLQGVQVPAPARGLRLPATGAAPALSVPHAAAAAVLLLLGAWLAAARRPHRWTERV